MKITDSNLIKSREKELLEMISADLDRDSIRQLLSAKYQLDLDNDSLACRGGDLVVHDNQVAYKVEYQAMINLSLLFNRQGECVETEVLNRMAGPAAPTDAPGQPTVSAPSANETAAVADAPQAVKSGPAEGLAQNGPSARMASSIADMIAEINKP